MTLFTGALGRVEVLSLRETKTLLLVGRAQLLPLREMEVVQRARLEGVPARQRRAVEAAEELVLQETDLTDALGLDHWILATGGA